MGASGAAGQQGGRIVLPLLQIHSPNNLLVAGHLHVPAQQKVSGPYQGIEPVNHQGDVAQKLKPVVPLLQMGLLVGQNVAPVAWTEPGGQVNPGPEISQNKGGRNPAALPDSWAEPNGFPQSQPEQNIGGETVKSKTGCSHGPDIPGDFRCRQGSALHRGDSGRLHRLSGDLPRLGGGFRWEGEGRLLLKPNIRFRQGLGIRVWGGADESLTGIVRQGLDEPGRTGHRGLQAKCAGNVQRHQQPHNCHQPQQADIFFRSASQNQPQGNHNPNENTALQTGLEDLIKQGFHGYSSWKLSISCWS